MMTLNKSMILKDEIRKRREKECFKIVDRACWYDTLSPEQKEEIKKWRQKWLEATETLVIPEKPNFID